MERYLIGIDPGIVNGFALYDRTSKTLWSVSSLKLHELFAELSKELKSGITYSPFHVFIEDPHTWHNFSGMADYSRLQGAGAVKQTYKHIIEFLEANSIPYTPTKLQGNMKKLKAEQFKQITGWDKPTNEHGRDAAMIVFGR
jgi:hypothetical protein